VTKCEFFYMMDLSVFGNLCVIRIAVCLFVQLIATQFFLVAMQTTKHAACDTSQIRIMGIPKRLIQLANPRYFLQRVWFIPELHQPRFIKKLPSGPLVVSDQKNCWFLSFEGDKGLQRSAQSSWFSKIPIPLSQCFEYKDPRQGDVFWVGFSPEKKEILAVAKQSHNEKNEGQPAQTRRWKDERLLDLIQAEDSSPQIVLKSKGLVLNVDLAFHRQDGKICIKTKDACLEKSWNLTPRPLPSNLLPSLHFTGLIDLRVTDDDESPQALKQMMSTLKEQLKTFYASCWGRGEAFFAHEGMVSIWERGE
jgi:hypothetical protein